MEFGARSLGNRSILASPLYKDMKDKINLDVKHRENWRPFCPSILDEDYERYDIIPSAGQSARHCLQAL